MNTVMTLLNISKKYIRCRIVFVSIATIIVPWLLYPSSSFAYKTKVHDRITLEAIDQSRDLYNELMKNIGFSGGVIQNISGLEVKTIQNWMQYGSTWEDDFTLWSGWRLDPIVDKRGSKYCHFYNPLFDIGYYNLLSDETLEEVGESLLHRMNDYIEDSENGWPEHNEWSYQMGRDLYYAALTGNSTKHDYWYMMDKYRTHDDYLQNRFEGKENMSFEEREKFFAWTFQAIGHIMHLIQDASVPAHTKNDLHANKLISWAMPGLNSEPYEEWTGKNFEENEQLMNYNGYGSDPWSLWKNYTYIPAQNAFIDTYPHPEGSLEPDPIFQSDDLDQGLAQYSYANFLSEDSVTVDNPLGHDLSSLSLDDFEDAILEESVQIGSKQKSMLYVKNEITNIDHFALVRLSWLIKEMVAFGPENTDITTLYYTVNDPLVSQDYASKLIPRAVGYSAGYLNYFFRGDFDVSSAFFTWNVSGELSGINMMVKNTSKVSESSDEIEAFSDGEISLVCKYIPPGADEYEYSLIENVYTVYGANDQINSEYVSINVQSLDEPIPSGATDISLTLVFRGKMGNETGAVAARVFKITSRIAYYTEPDMADNTANIFTILPDGTDTRQITDATEPSLRHYTPAWSQDGRLLAFTRANCANPQPDGSCLWVDYEKDITVIEQPFSQASYPGNVVSTLQYWDADKWDQPEAVHLQSFSFSPDGGRLVAVVSEYASDRGALVVYDVSQESWNYLYNYVQGGDPSTARWYLSDLVNAPEWSPKEDAITFCRVGFSLEGSDGTFEEGKSSIWTVNPNSGEMMRITNVVGDGYDEYDTTQPVWTKDGEQILFVSDREEDGVSDIWIMDRTGANQEKVFNCIGDCFSPSMSPDRQKIAFEMDSNIYTVNIDGSDLFQVTDSGRAKAPAWSPMMLDVIEP